MGKQNKANYQADFSNIDKSSGFYPKCLTMPLLAFVGIVVVLFFVAILLCRGGVADCCKNGVESPTTAQTTPQKDNELPKDMENIRENKVGSVTTLGGQSKPKEAWQIAQERFVEYNSIDENYKLKESLFFDKNSSFLGAKQQANFARNLQENVVDAKLAIIFGYGCDLGSEEYNVYLIDKRINRVVEAIAKQYPNIKILSSNEGQYKDDADEKTRESERRVDIYFY